MVKSTDRAHGSNTEKSWKYQLLGTYFNTRVHPEPFTKEYGTLSHPALLLITKIAPVRSITRNNSHYAKEPQNCALPHLRTASKQQRRVQDCDRFPARAV